MKAAFLSLVLFLAASTAFAEDGSFVDYLPNGDVTLVNVSPGRAAPCQFVVLNTNEDYKVLCQVYYRDNLNPKPTTAEEINRNDTLVNLLLARYLADEFQKFTPDYLVHAYSNGIVSECLVLDFPDWAQKMVSALYEINPDAAPDLTITAVTMEAVGKLETCVAE